MRIQLTGFFFLCMVLLAACGSKDRLPDDIMPPNKMQAVLWDMMRADQFISDYVVSRDTSRNKDKESIKLYSRIFTLHKITREEFDRSFDYYRTHPARLQPLMDSMSRQSLAAPTQPMVTDTVRIPDTTRRPDTTYVPQVRPQVKPRPFRGDTTRPFFRKN